MLHSVVKTKRNPSVNGKPTIVLNLHLPRNVLGGDDAKHIVSVEASIWCDNSDWFDGIAKGMEMVVLEMWKVKCGSRSLGSDGDKYRLADFTVYKFSINPVITTQIARVPDNGN